MSLKAAKNSGGEQVREKVPMRLKLNRRELVEGNIAARYTQQAAGGNDPR